MKYIAILTIVFATAFSFGQSLELQINTENAYRTFQFLQSNSQSRQKAQVILNLAGTTGMIIHDGEFDSQLTQENFIDEIINVSSATDAFRFKGIRKQLSEIEETISLLNDSINYITNRIQNNLRPYSPTLDRPIDVYCILGGNSDGYTLDENSFYIELQFFGSDIEGIISIITHEVYHIVQQRNSISAPVNAKWESVKSLVDNLYQEGSASYVGDPSSIENPKYYAVFMQEKYNRNLAKLAESFYLFECLLQQAVHDPNEDLIYGIGFGGQWDSPLYFVGYEICRQFEAHEKFSIATYIDKPAIDFLLDYIMLYKSKPDIPHKFSKITEHTLSTLKSKLR